MPLTWSKDFDQSKRYWRHQATLRSASATACPAFCPLSPGLPGRGFSLLNDGVTIPPTGCERAFAF